MADKDLEKVTGGSLGNDERIIKTDGSGAGRRTNRPAPQSLGGAIRGGLAQGFGSEESVLKAPALAARELKEELLKRLPFGSVLDDDLLAKLTGGLALPAAGDLAFRPDRDSASSDDLVQRPDNTPELALLLADMPTQFASVEDLKRWLAENEDRRYRGPKSDVRMI